MPLTRAKKTEKIAQLAAELEHSTSAIVGTFAGLTASKDFELRKAVRAAGGSYHVVKNKLAARAGEGTKIEAALKGLKGVSSVAYTSGDPVALAKALSTWVKDNAEFTFKLGIVDGKVITVQEIKATRHHAGQGRALLEAALPHPVPRAASRHGHQRHRPRSRRRHQPGRREGQVRRRRSSALPQLPRQAAAEAPAAAAKPRQRRLPQPMVSSSLKRHAAGEQPSGAAQPENATASQAGEAATTDPVEGA